MMLPAGLLALVALVLAVCGILLMVRGLRPRRFGQTPHCRRCDYNLTGLSSDKCPECGNTLQPNGIIVGEGGRSLRRIVGGGLCLLPLIAVLIVIAANINWIRVHPVSWLVTDAQSNNGSVANRAWTELLRRDAAGSLSTGQRSSVIDACLQQQSMNSSAALAAQMADYLGHALLKQQLSPTQEATFYQQIVALKLTVRPKILQGDPVPYVVVDRGRTPGSGFWMQTGTANKMIDGRIIQPDMPLSGASAGCGGNAGEGGSVAFAQLGRYELSLEYLIAFYAGPFNQRDQSTLLHELGIPLQASFEVLPADTTGLIKVIRDPALTQTLQDSISITKLQYATHSEARISWTIRIDPLPVPVAFEIIARIEGKEWVIGSIYRPPNDAVQWSASKAWWGPDRTAAPPPFTTCDVILRGSDQAARESVDLFEYWEGELVYKDVPVELDTPLSRPAR